MAAWLDLVSDSTGWTLVDTGRLDELVKGMSHPNTQFPSVVYFAGNGSRIKALRALFPHNNITRRGPAGLARLHLSTRTANSQHPVLLVESSLSSVSGVGESDLCRWSSDNFRRYRILQDRSQRVPEIQQQVISQMLLPWTNLFCVFVDTHSEIRDACQLLNRRRRTVTIGSEPTTDSMRIVIVVTAAEGSELEDVPEVFHGLQSPGILNNNVTVLDLRDRCGLSPTAAFEPLRRLILNETQEIRAEQSHEGLLFSATHLNTLWTQTLRLEIGPSDATVLDCLEVARENQRLNNITTECLVEFISQASNRPSSKDEIHVFIASALLMNAYPPGMHGFHPDHVFNTLYRGHCLEAWRKMGDNDEKQHCNAVFAQFTRFFHSMSPIRSSASIRRDALNTYYLQCNGLTSTTTCFYCLCRSPEHMLACRHAICDTCVVIFGTPNKSAEYHFDIMKCPLCHKTSQLTIRQLPPTKRPLVLSLDGGGVRGIIQLGLLRALEKRLGDKMRIPDIFDLSGGTSVGALNEIDIILNGSSAEDSFRKFPAFARDVFQLAPAPSQKFSIFRCAKWIKCVAGFLADGQYDGIKLESTLKEAIDPERRMFDVSTTRTAGSRVAIITSRISDGKACVLANYRGVGQRPIDSAYQFLKPEEESQNPFLWEAFFQTKTLPGFGPLQDGGVRANNPLAIALKESATIWPSHGTPDLLVSVGTGLSTPGYKAQDTPLGSILQDGAVPRLIRAAMCSPSMDGEQGFFEALNYVPDRMRAHIYRLNHAIPWPLPRLDDVDRLIDLAELSYSVPDDLVRAILATGFLFFELDELPVRKQGSLYCQGSILCSSPDAGDLIKRVLLEFPGPRFQTGSGYHLGLIGNDDECRHCGYYRKKVTFTVKSLEEVISIEIANSSFRHKIGGFPKSMQKILEDQQAYACFGRADHLEVCWPPRRICYCARGTKRRVQFLEPCPERKRRRL
ncbi:uncharacterized protein N7515_001301 [Penicillium bovifimosum]|uniref:PNPLA domain-containing protein n=1 Tax=Penicillium bovifimosum TaxID=126998 RepID=A0A9W9L8K2_9EURO|nr:uncharacterized protein N7515_001301 [Penicillium bovifimosum]KAJ5142514.1 hypothetical protein N7515_001301 [Penicillium bovifimosum]